MFFYKFIKGDLPLWQSYWIVGILFGIVAAILYGLDQYPIFNNIIIILFYLFWIIGVWKSGLKYKGKKIWVILSRVTAIIGFLGEIGSMLFPV